MHRIGRRPPDPAAVGRAGGKASVSVTREATVTRSGNCVFQSSDLRTPEGSFWQAGISRACGPELLQVLWTVDFIAHFLGWASPHYSREFVTKPLRRHARRARGAARRGNATPGSSEGGVPPSWGFYKGAGPLVRVGEAGFWAEPTRKGGILETVC